MAEHGLLEQLHAVQQDGACVRRPVFAGWDGSKCVDQTAQLPTGLLNGFEPAVLFHIQIGLADQPRHTEQSVEHIAQLVAKFCHGLVAGR